MVVGHPSGLVVPNTQLAIVDKRIVNRCTIAILCFAVVFTAVSTTRGVSHPRQAGADDHAARSYHAHTHLHDGQTHTHWHSHAGHEDHSKPDADGDHHDAIDRPDGHNVPLYSLLARVAQGRESTGKLVVLCQSIVSLYPSDPPALPPPKPPPKLSSDEDNLLRLRTVILLT